jgi:hypothetical protein
MEGLTDSDKPDSIPEWIIKYDQAGHQSSAGKAIRILLSKVKELEGTEKGCWFCLYKPKS